jgi:hypothetical protein
MINLSVVLVTKIFISFYLLVDVIFIGYIYFILHALKILIFIINFIWFLPKLKFHVHPHSSAHVYLRLQPGQSWENIPPKLLEDLGQLTKANSIKGSS